MQSQYIHEWILLKFKILFSDNNDKGNIRKCIVSNTSPQLLPAMRASLCLDHWGQKHRSSTETKYRQWFTRIQWTCLIWNENVVLCASAMCKQCSVVCVLYTIQTPELCLDTMCSVSCAVYTHLCAVCTQICVYTCAHSASCVHLCCSVGVLCPHCDL